MNHGITRRDFLITAAGVTGAVLLSPLIANANQPFSQNENFGPALEDWLLSTGMPVCEPTISFLVSENTTAEYLPFSSNQ